MIRPNRPSFFQGYINEICRKTGEIDEEMLEEAATIIAHAGRRNSKILMAGNGASASIASHVTVDITKMTKIRAVNFNESDLITCFANDYGYEHWVEEALNHYADPDDVVILVSSSGNSMNIVNAAKKARLMGNTVLTFSGFGRKNKLRDLGHLNFWVDSSEYNVVEIVHNTWLLSIVERVLKIKEGAANSWTAAIRTDQPVH